MNIKRNIVGIYLENFKNKRAEYFFPTFYIDFIHTMEYRIEMDGEWMDEADFLWSEI